MNKPFNQRSVQDHRETIAGNHRAAIEIAGQFFAGISDRFDALKQKTAHVSDFRRLRNEVGGWLQNHVNGGGKWTEDQQAAFEYGEAWLGIIDNEVTLRVTANTALGGTLFEGSRSSGWCNAETGEPVRLYAPDEKIAAERPYNSGPSLGALIAGKLLGAKTAEIRNALDEGTDSAGGYSVPTYVMPQFIDHLRSKVQMVNAGASVMMLEGKTRIVRTDADPTAAWRSENVAIGESDPTFSAVDLIPQDLAVLVKVSREVLADSVNIQNALERAIVGAMSVELDRAGLFGSGAAPEPLGLFNTTGVGSVSMGTNGATPSNYDDLLETLYQLEVSNAADPTALIWHPRTARTYRKLKDTTNQPMEAPAPLDQLPMLSTTGVPIDQTQGTAAGVCSTVLMGDFSQAIIGIREQMNIRFLTERFADVGQYAFVAHLRADFAFAHPESFAKLIGIKP